MVECSLHPGARKTKRKKANVTAHSSDSTYVRVARRGSNPHSQTSWVPPRCQRLSFGLAVLSGMNYGPLHVHTHPRAAGGGQGTRSPGGAPSTPTTIRSGQGRSSISENSVKRRIACTRTGAAGVASRFPAAKQRRGGTPYKRLPPCSIAALMEA